MLAAEPKCPACGTVIPANAPEGQCIHCALRLLLERNEPDAPPAAPIRFAGYELLEKIGEGGMGVVWKARQLKANRLVAPLHVELLAFSIHLVSERPLRTD